MPPDNKSNKSDLFACHPRDLAACMTKVRQLNNCLEIANLISSELSLGRLLSNVMDTVKTAFQADSASLLLLEEDTGDLVFHIALGEVGEDIRELYRLKKGQGIAGLVAQTGISLNLEDVYDHPNFSKAYDLKTNYRTRAMICVPLKARGKTLGVIQVMNKQLPPFVFSKEELDMLATIASSAAVAVDTAHMHRKILRRETLERDLALAREVQQSFLPPEMPRCKGWDFFAVNRPALEIGGDFFSFSRLSDNRMGIALGDVSGKGISAALFMARLISDIQYHSLLCKRPDDLLNLVNTLLCQRSKHGMFVTLVYIILNLDTGELCFSNAGHLAPVCSGGKSPLPLGSEDAKGPPLGILPEITYAMETAVIDRGAALTLYTDGVTESKNGFDRLFGEARLLSVLQKKYDTARHLVSAVSQAVDKFSLDRGRSDDITMISILRT